MRSERNVIAISSASLLMGFGEELWKGFVPKYLEVLGAPVQAVGLYGTLRDFLDGLYQYPGGWVTDHYGRRFALALFVAIAVVGYLAYAFAPSWPYVLAGTTCVMAWAAMANPTIFAVIGDSLPKHRRALGFTVQSTLKRVPIAIAPALGGLIIARYGVDGGVRLSLMATVILAAVTLAVVSHIRLERAALDEPTGMAGVWHSMAVPLRRLLVSDIIVRMCEGLVDVFLVLYAVNIAGVSATQFGLLIAVKAVTSMVAYLPAARFADRVGRKPFVIATFSCFALFPLAVILATDFTTLVLAFIVGGLREIGEPSRKAMIVDFAANHLRGRTVGLYYLIRSLSVTPAALIGGLLWTISPNVPFIVAGVTGFVGTAVFAVTVEERYAA